MDKFLSILAMTIATTLVATSFTPAHAGLNWNEVWGTLKKGGVQQPTPEPSQSMQPDFSSSGAPAFPDSSAIPNNGSAELSTNENGNTDFNSSTTESNNSNTDFNNSTTDSNNTNTLRLNKYLLNWFNQYLLK
jgi:hypothetical protein